MFVKMSRRVIDAVALFALDPEVGSCIFMAR
jgi:hypothetical protein